MRALVAGDGGELSPRSVPVTGTTAEIRLPAERVISGQRSAVSGQ
jgi:hypothetical protein